ncbi:DMT family transporter [Paenibacillus polysaccharolyticus]|uniref:EamA-like transporter family protein n=2 Tax=Paenibacillus TaxID=44249 RepID=A0A1G5JMF6_9BACL|nr:MULTISPECIES: EamA family transporter [Paenibacillus]MDP9701406.1 putative membrane protein [Paenibacillus intestini]MBY0202276.1 EamA family transporter [Paenibacillus cucumis (ex Kampfer et al. 2016)]MCM3131379.1 DMT family transporter [Paenibacillus polysaccharolyticus]MCP1135134.1 DMT family transporter [Paenibacillus polysaccharolyticus]SCY89533.1 EamA-like transporter family protein [Paenibacillus polysaccharolyticus]
MILPLILVLASGMAHAVWSMFTKRSLNKSVFLWSIMMIPTVLLLPVLVVELSRESLPVSAYALLIVSMALQALYSWLLSQTYELGDLSQIYPIMRGTSTLLVPLIGVAFLGERLSGFGWLGIACMIVGFIVLSGVGSRKGQAGSGMKGAKPVLMALCVGLCTTSYVFVDKLNLQHISPLALLEVTNIGFVAGLTPALLASAGLRQEWKVNRSTILLGALLNPGSYLLFLFALEQAPMARLGPLREVGTVFAAFLGIWLLKEQQGMKRILCSIVIFGGILLIGVWG